MNDDPRTTGPGDTAPPRPAASLVLLRDAAPGLQVLLLERPSEDRVLAGARVFPGGKLDREDADDDLIDRFGLHPHTLHARLGEPELDAVEAAALFVAAIREAFEETGVLLVRDIDDATASQARALRREGFGFGELMERLDLRFDASLMQPWSRWVTPKVPSQMRRRFDTRFFVARLPEGQEAVHDPSEAVAADWMGPREAIERYWAGEIDMAAPQIMTLAHLSRFADVDAALADASRRVPPVIRPEPFETATGRLLCYPGDPKHPVPERAMPGPTRLLFEQGRFRPESGGLEAWFD
ncbi:MAG: NUDIX hydrolase [Burkholderiales bacterium]|jgi:8-oxo-dGTP pyrophosphatase MutT (NUDIX family)